MAKTCLQCQSPVFSKNLCKYHWGIKYSKPLKRTPIKKSVTTIAKISDNKKKQDVEYKRTCRAMDVEAKISGRWLCFFCGRPLYTSCDHHHVAGKSGTSDNNVPLYLDKTGIVLCHRVCHRRYHDIKIAELLKAPYYKALMEKIYYICKAKYYNMKAKHDKLQNR